MKFFSALTPFDSQRKMQCYVRFVFMLKFVSNAKEKLKQFQKSALRTFGLICVTRLYSQACNLASQHKVVALYCIFFIALRQELKLKG